MFKYILFSLSLLFVSFACGISSDLTSDTADLTSHANASVKIVFLGNKSADVAYARLRSDPHVLIRLNIQNTNTVVFENILPINMEFYLTLEDAYENVIKYKYFIANLEPGKQSEIYVNLSNVRAPEPVDNYSDVWKVVKPGVSYLQRTSAAPKRFHAVYVDLLHPQVKVIATAPGERKQTPTQFARAKNTLVTINGDFFDKGNNYKPHGLAVGQGQHWTGTADLPGHTSFIACVAKATCFIDSTESVRPRNPAWKNVVSGDGIIVAQGKVYKEYEPCDGGCEVLNPRTAVGMSSNSRYLILTAVEGRQGALEGLGLKELGLLMRHLGAHNALNFDGGGSTGMVIKQKPTILNPSGQTLVNRRPFNELKERVVSNHLAIVY